jgi:MYXO-CTERM domain-containing protein
VPITWTLVDAPVIAVSPVELSFAARSVGSSPPSQTLSIDNPGSGLLDFFLACDPAWLSCAPASGTAPAAITVAVDASGLAVGHHAGTITVSAAAAIHSPVIVDVGLLIESGSNAPPPAPALLSPVDGAANQGTRPTLGIENAADPDGDAVTYTFEVAVSGASTPVVVIEEVAEGTGNSTEITLPAQLAPSITYTWRARAVDLWGAEGAWSDSWSFTVAAASPSRPSTATSEGCACSSSGDSPAWLLGLGALFSMRRRRRVASSNGRSGRSGRAARSPAR